MTTETTVNKLPETTVTRAEHTRNRPTYRPNVDILETAEELTVYADMPGMSPDDVDVQFENGSLTIHGKVCERQREDANFLVREYGVGDFYRTFQVSELIDATRIHAEYANGVLILHLPKTEAARPRRIEVRAK